MIINKIICDRCGYEMEMPAGAQVTVTWFELNDVGCQHELCGACVAALHEWLNKGEKE